MPDKRGLLYCSYQFSTDPFCIVKLIELILSACLLIVIVYDMVVRYKYQKYVFNLFYGLCVLMLAALICNIGFCLNHQIFAFNYLQGFFFNIYFVCIVYYVAYKLLYVMQAKKMYVTILHALYGITIAFFVVVLVQKFLSDYSSCEQLWYIIVSGVSIFLSIALTITGATYTRNQILKLTGMQNPNHYKNPLPNIWIWISINIFSQLCSFIQSMIFQLNSTANCKFSNNFGLDQAIKLLFVFLTFHIGMISTIVFFRNKYKNQKQNVNIANNNNSQIRQTVNIQLIQDFSVTS